ncbi:hypothetical protein BCU23_21605 [Vibrio splendidus]|nr:hypothetical protein BCU63_07405 [Vibrio splendidus]PMJ58738.1 hypothetical protein BCU23_21605 [Vibrio splendidus]
MFDAELYTPEKTTSLSLPPFRLLQLSRPTTRCKFVRQGDSVHLLIYLHRHADIPFLRVPADSLYRAARAFIAYDKTIS